jgi:LysR family glycine cleavage system transcriptional activator
MSRLPSLNALRAFECVARLGALNRAAEEMNVTESAVSRQIRALEDDLHVELFRRVHRGVRLSPQGEQLAQALEVAFEAIRRGVESIRDRPGVVRVRTPPTFGTRWLLPRLHRFEVANPDISVRVAVLSENMEPSDIENDVGIINSSKSWGGEARMPFLMERLTPVCSPAYLERLGPGDALDLVERGQLLHCEGNADWRRWADHAFGEGTVAVDRGETFITMDMALRAAETGRGFAIADLSMVEEDVSIGRLVAPFRIVAQGADDFFLVRRDRFRPRPEVSRFVEWLYAEVEEMNEGRQ